MSSINMPKGRDMSTELSKTLSAQIGMLPSLLGAQQQYAPLQAAGQLSNLSTMLLGSPGGTYDEQIYTPSVLEKGGKFRYGGVPAGTTGRIVYPNLPGNRPSSGDDSGGGLGIPGLPGMGGGGGGLDFGGGFDMPGMGGGIPGMPGSGGFNPLDPLGGLFGGGNSGPRSRIVNPAGYQTVQHTFGPQRGLLDIYSKDVAPTLGELERSQASLTRGADVSDLTKLGPQGLLALQNADPAMAGLINKLTTSAQTQLDADTNLDPGLARVYQQSARGAQAARGLGFSPSDVLGETMGLTQLGQQLRQQRQGFASGVAGLRQNIYQNPLLQMILKSGGNTLGGAQSTVGQAMGLGSSGNNFLNLLNPESSYGSDLNNTNFNALVAQAIGNANNKNALIGAGISSLGSLAGGAAGMI